MRSYLVLFLFFVGLMITSCSEQGKAKPQETEIEVDDANLDRDEDHNDSDTETIDVEKEAPLTWKSYHNQRFDFCVGYPTNFLRELGESENHDGNTFANANGSSEMRASGMYNALEQTIGEAYKSATKNDRYYEDERIVTYKAQKGNWFVVSGRYYESIFYVKTVLKGDNFYTLYFEYHPSEEAKFKEIIKQTTKDFPKC